MKNVTKQTAPIGNTSDWNDAMNEYFSILKRTGSI